MYYSDRDGFGTGVPRMHPSNASNAEAAVPSAPETIVIYGPSNANRKFTRDAKIALRDSLLFGTNTSRRSFSSRGYLDGCSVRHAVSILHLSFLPRTQSFGDFIVACPRKVSPRGAAN